MPYARYADRLARTREYNATPRGRAVKRAARLRQLERERDRKLTNIEFGPLVQAARNWREQ